MRFGLLLVLGGVLTACGAPELGAPTAQDAKAAEQFAVTAIETRFPSYTHAAPVAACVQENATDDEVMILSGRQGPASESNRITLAVAIAQRPATRTCITNKNVPPLG